MKLKQFYFDNKEKINSIFQKVLSILIFIVLFFSVYACGYYSRDKLDFEDNINLVENKQNFNNENIVKVLRDKKNVRDMDIQTSGSVFPVGLVRTVDGLDVEFFVNAESSLYTYLHSTFKEIVLELTLNTYAIVYDASFNKITSTINTLSYEYSVNIPLNREIDRYFIGVEYFDAQFEDYVEDEGDAISIDLSHTYDFFYVIQDRKGQQVDGYSETIKYDGLRFITDNSSYWSEELLNNFDNGYKTRFNPSSLLIPNNYLNGYNDGVNKTEDYYEKSIIPAVKTEYEEIGYDKGYDVGFFEGKDVGYDEGYDVGFFEGKDLGHNEGFDLGYEEGFSEGKLQNNAILKPFELIVKGVEPVILVLSSEIAPGITIGTIALIPLAVTMIVFLLKGLVL